MSQGLEAGQAAQRRRATCIVLCTLAVLGIAPGASAQTQPSATTPVPANRVPTQKNVVYAALDGKPLLLDIYTPPLHGGETAHPALLRLGPGREAPGGAADELLGDGYTLIYAAYLPEGSGDHAFSKFPQDVQAAKAAVRYVRGNAQALTVNPDRIGLWGTGPGATVAALTAFTPDQKDLNGALGDFSKESSAVRAVCLFEGITDWRYAELYGDETVNFPASAAYQLFGGNTKEFPDAARQASTVNYIRPTSPATLMVTLTTDQQRAMHQIFAETLRKASVPSALYEETAVADRVNEAQLNQTVVAFFEDTMRGTRGDPKKMTVSEEVDALIQAGLFKQARRLVEEQMAGAKPEGYEGPPEDVRAAMAAASKDPTTATYWLAKFDAISRAEQAPALQQLAAARHSALPGADAGLRTQWTIREVLTDPERIGRYSVEASVPQKIFDLRADALRFVDSLNGLILQGDARGADSQATLMRAMALKGDADPAILTQFLTRYDQIKGHTLHVLPPGMANAVFANDFGQDLYGYWMDLKAGGVVQRLRYVAPGHYTRGSAREEWGRLPGEPILEPTDITRGFWLGDSPVTQGLYEGVMGADANHSAFRVTGRSAEVRDKLPVENASYAHAVNFMNKLGIGARLPTAAEWEYACRAGTNYMYAGTGRLSDIAWFWDEKRDANGQTPTATAPAVTDHGAVDVRILHDLDLERSEGVRLTHPVKQKLPNAWGLYDMQGNVWQWCSGTSPDRPRDYHPLKGGSWISIPQSCRAARELWLPVETQSWNIGMRICIPAP